jgi:hypothetical protein
MKYSSMFDQLHLGLEILSYKLNFAKTQGHCYDIANCVGFIEL